MKRAGTASNIEIKRWVTESKMFSDDYPVFAILEDENGRVVERFTIEGCRTNGETMCLKLKRK